MYDDESASRAGCARHVTLFYSNICLNPLGTSIIHVRFEGVGRGKTKYHVHYFANFFKLFDSVELI